MLDRGDSENNKGFRSVYEVAEACESLADSMALMAEWLLMGASRVRDAGPEVDPRMEEALALTEHIAREHRDMAAQLYAAQHQVLGQDRL